MDMSAEIEIIRASVQLSTSCLRVAVNDLGQAIRSLSIANLHMMRGDNDKAFVELEAVAGFLQEARSYADQADAAAERLAELNDES